MCSSVILFSYVARSLSHKIDAMALQYAATYIAQVLHPMRTWPCDLMKSATW